MTQSANRTCFWVWLIRIGFVQLGLFPWLVCLFCFCRQEDAPTHPTTLRSRIDFFHKNRQAFDSYVARLERNEIEWYRSSYALPPLFADNGIHEVHRDGDCIEIVFGFFPTDSVPEFIYSPQGLERVPERYRTGREPSGAKLSYWKFVVIDERWFYCDWDQ